MKTQVTIIATFKHDKKFNFAAVRDGILIGMRDAFLDDLEVTGDIDVTKKSKLNAIHDKMGHYICNDGEDYPKIIRKLKKLLKDNPTALLDYVDGIQVWEKVEGSFTVSAFCELVGITIKKK